MKKLFLILIPIIFLFCLNIGVQTASADCSSCEKCVNWDCTDGDYECTSSGTVCDQDCTPVCTGYGDSCPGGQSWECSGDIVERCKNWSIGVCQGWEDICTDWKDSCTIDTSTLECVPGTETTYCILETTQCTGGYEDECTGGWEDVCDGVWGYVCDGGWDYGCISWDEDCVDTNCREECTNEEWVCYEKSCVSCSPYCSGSDSSCGCTSCVDCNAQDGCVGTTYNDYSCSGNSCAAATTENSSECGGCVTAADCGDYFPMGECADAAGGSSGIVSAVRCNEGVCEVNFGGGECSKGCCGGGEAGSYCCGNCNDKCVGYQMSECSGNTLKTLDLVDCADGCDYNFTTCECGCSSGTCLSKNDAVKGCEDIGGSNEECVVIGGEVWFNYNAYHCKTAGSFNISDDFFTKIKKIFSSEAKADEECYYHNTLHCIGGSCDTDGGCTNTGLCPAGCVPDNCGAAECAGCSMCSVDCPDRCVGSVYQSGILANDEGGHATCFYDGGEWCGDGCCEDPDDPDYEPPEAPSCFWELKGCGYGGCPATTHKGRLCVGIGGCAEDVCTLGDTDCVLADCGGPPPPEGENIDPVAIIDYFPSDTITTDENNFTLKGGNSSDSDGWIVNYSWIIPFLGRIQNSSDPDFFLGKPAVGTHWVILAVTDNENAINIAFGSFTVEQALVADFEWEPKFPIRNEEVDFTDLSAGDIVSWLWTFEDGDIPIGEETKQHPKNIKFTSHGSKKVRLTITDSLGKSVFKDRDIDVKIPMPKWRETHPKSENIFDNPLLIFASLIEYFEG